MVAAPTPTRADTSDAATAIYGGADAIMLSAESATAQYPCEAATNMSRIIESTERHKMYRSIVNASEPDEEQTAPTAAAADLATMIGASAILAFTSSGTTATRIARKRPKVLILAITPEERVSRQLCLLWGRPRHEVPQHKLLRGDGRTRDANRSQRELLRRMPMSSSPWPAYVSAMPAQPIIYAW